MRTIAVVGNPKVGSRTADAAQRVALALGADDVELIEVAELGPGLLGWGDPEVTAAKKRVQEAQLVVFASPTFKATYTGLLKLFLDQFEGGTGLAGVVAVPLMLGAGPGHAMAPDLLLKPVLVEIGGTCPTSGLYLIDSTFTTDGSIATWASRWAPAVAALTAN